MTVSYAKAKTQVKRLVDRFAGLRSENRKRYNEPATRQEFILPLFRALGWNIEDTREVSPEEKVSRGFVDFAFRIRGIPRFFVETKRIPADLEDPRWARQAINYAWLKGVTWAVLTDFEGLKVFNAEWQEAIPARAIFKDLTWDQYPDRFDDLWLLSRPAVEEGALDRAAEAVGKKVKRTPVNRLLLADLTQWRRDLFQTLRAYNRSRPVEQIDQAVQRILDRLIFIRTLEDREIEPYRLQPLVREWRDRARKRDLMSELNAIFREFDAGYDTRLFAPHLCEELEGEPTPFEAVIGGLYEVPGGYGFYDFNAIDADVLGAIYEQYLGHRAQDPEGKAAVSKREKRKAHGIYYTPRFVVRYIVEQTLGRLLKEADYERARQVRVLDMACGSGSFLIEAFDVLDRYLAGVRGQNAASAAGDTHDFARRMEILTGNLYGVDLDAQAVEIARLNLLLKAVNQRGRLPELANVRQGNSLIGGAPEELEAAFGVEWRDKHPFDWEEQFPQIMERGGFDVIVGNPPYIRIQTLPKDEVAFYSNRYQAATGNYDIYTLFVERALQLLRPGGLFGFILPHRFFKTNYGKGLREFIVKHQNVREILDFDGYMVFEGASINTCLLILGKEPEDKFRFSQVRLIQPPTTEISAVLEKIREADQLRVENVTVGMLPQSNLTEEPWVFVFPEEKPLWQKLNSMASRLGDVTTRIFQGLKTGGDAVYSLEVVREGEETARVSSLRDGHEYDIERAILKPLIKGGEMKRYHIGQTSRRVLFPYREGKLIPADQLQREYARAWAYLCEHKEYLENRERGKMRGTEWYGYTRSQALNTVCRPKILTPEYYAHASYCFDEEGEYYFFGGGAGGYGIVPKSGIEPRYVLALLNSKLLDWYLHKVSMRAYQTAYMYVKKYIEQLPIRRINFDDPADVAQHDRMVEMVEEMLRLQKEHAQADALKEDRRHDLARQIEQLDAQIDALVYELYGLTEEEIAIIERQELRKGRIQ